jgi:hypothetical protein
MIPEPGVRTPTSDTQLHTPMRIATPLALAALLLGAPLAAQSLAPEPGAAPAPAPSLVFVDAGRVGPSLAPLAPAPAALSLAAPLDTPSTRPRAIEHSDAYYTRLSIHRWASYTMPPLFVGQYLLGEQLIRKRERGEDPGSTKGLHSTVAGGIGALFVVNTVTGVWNLYEDRNEPVGRTRRLVHVVSMLAADAGFVATGLTAEDDGGEGEGEGGGEISTHRNLAYGSMAIALASGAIMWFWKD